MRSRVTAGALVYSARTCLKREASPSAFAITRCRYPSASCWSREAAPRAFGITSFAYAWPSFFCRSRSCPALTASSNAACTCSGGWAPWRRLHVLVSLPRPGQPPAQPRAGLLGEFAERQHYAALAFHDDVEPAREPDRQHDSREQPGAAEARSGEEARRLAAACAAATAEQLAQAAIEVAPELVQIRRALISAARAAGTS